MGTDFLTLWIRGVSVVKGKKRVAPVAPARAAMYRKERRDKWGDGLVLLFMTDSFPEKNSENERVQIVE
ncbi:MAG: hypothetical protein D3909_00320 [Candidatus Electrothrix sp. ATG1]|nr:hypothetical protein [Candidatus Electrothrix sp. ATG1]